jgi:Flp pilus assembly pilin Flp
VRTPPNGGVRSGSAINSRKTKMLRRLLTEDAGQDIVEYGLLAALIGVASVLIWQTLVTQIQTTYSNANTDVQTVSACTPDPGGGGC